jgi:hypothetical protein
MSANKLYRKLAKKQLQASAAQYPKERLVEIPKSEWIGIQTDPKRISVWACRNFFIQVFAESDGIFRLTVSKDKLGFGASTFADGISWDELQWIKDSCGFSSKMAVEIYPAKDRILADCNLRHLWILPTPLNIGWNLNK